MRRKTIAMLLLTGIMQAAVAVNASANVVVEPEKSSVTISGVIDAEDKITNIGIDVFCPSYDYEALKSVPADAFKRAIVFRNQAVSNDKGEWSITFRIQDDEAIDYDAPSGRYTAVIYPQNAQKAYIEEFAYTNLTAAQKAVDRIKGGEAISDIIKEAPADLGLTDYYGASLSPEKLAKLIQDARNSGKLESENIIEVIGVIQNAAVIEAISEGKINDLFAYKEPLRLAESKLAPYLDRSYLSANSAQITSALKGEYFNTYAQFYNRLEEAAVLEVVKNPDGISNLREITEAIVGSKSYGDDVYRSVMGKTYKSLANYTNALDKNNSSNNSGGSAGGGSGGKSQASGIQFTGTKQQPVETMTYNIFNDIEAVEWARDAIVYLAQAGIVSGKSEALFYPNDHITREELVKILVLAFAEDTEAEDIYFKDVDKSAWYYAYLAKAVKAGIVSGYSEDVFGTGDPVTRQDMVAMIYRAAKFRGINLESAAAGFADEAQIAEYARDAVGALYAKGIVNGVDKYTFAPLEPATRAQVAKIVYRVLLI